MMLLVYSLFILNYGCIGQKETCIVYIFFLSFFSSPTYRKFFEQIKLPLVSVECSIKEEIKLVWTEIKNVMILFCAR